MGWIKSRLKAAGHGIENGVKSFIHNTKDQGIYVGYHANGDGTNGQGYIKAGPISYGTDTGFSIDPAPVINTIIQKQNSGKTTYTPTYTPTNTPTSNKPPAYSRTSAATANDIAQGGMTKDEVQEFNMKHPNETALRR